MEFKKDIFLADLVVGEHDANNVWFKAIQGTNRLDENVMIHKLSNKEFFLIDETTNKQLCFRICFNINILPLRYKEALK
jgi:hypothetical protein